MSCLHRRTGERVDISGCSLLYEIMQRANLGGQDYDG